MLFPRSLVLCMFLFFADVVTALQINLDLTEWTYEGEKDAVLRHDCLHPLAWIGHEDHIHKVIAYCLSEWASPWNIPNNGFNKALTILDLFKLHITSDQLYLWSAPMDVIENYQLYLDKSLTTSMPVPRFYNCTPPRFGSLCQYSFDNDQSSLPEVILRAFANSRFQRRTLWATGHSPIPRERIPM